MKNKTANRLEKNNSFKEGEGLPFVERHFNDLVIITSLCLGILLGISAYIFFFDFGYWSALALGIILVFLVAQMR